MHEREIKARIWEIRERAWKLPSLGKGIIYFLIHFVCSTPDSAPPQKETFNPLNPNIKIQILICYPYTFSLEVVGRICWSIN